MDAIDCNVAVEVSVAWSTCESQAHPAMITLYPSAAASEASSMRVTSHVTRVVGKSWSVFRCNIS